MKAAAFGVLEVEGICRVAHSKDMPAPEQFWPAAQELRPAGVMVPAARRHVDTGRTAGYLGKDSAGIHLSIR